MPAPAPPREIVAALLPWYAANARILPWRSEPTGWRVLLSELMLQQTRVETVLPYFARFVARWPTPAALAAASEAEVVEAWAGLGYYSRARSLHRCAQAAADGVPETVEGLRALPGVGPYTAGAVASIAFGVRTPLVDGNVERVLSRLDACREDVSSKAGKAALWARAGALIDALTPDEAPGALNQALMELGATVCTPKRPSCASCPLAEVCLGRDDPARYPVKPPKAKPVPITGIAAVIEGPQGVLLARRAPTGLLGGLWEPPRADDAPGLEALLTALGITPGRLRRCGAVTHVFTHRRLVCEVVAGSGQGTPTPAGPYDAVCWSDAPSGLSTLAKKLLAAAGDAPLLAADAASR